MSIYRNMRSNNEQAFSLLEIMASIFIAAIIGLSLANSMITAMFAYKSTQINSAISNLALNRIEQYSAINPQSMDATSHDTSETGLTNGMTPNITYSRVTNVTVNADTSRTVAVTVSCSSTNCSKSVTYENTFTRW